MFHQAEIYNACLQSKQYQYYFLVVNGTSGNYFLMIILAHPYNPIYRTHN